MSKAIYAFSGDPITYGHIDIVERAAKVFSEVMVAIGIAPEKTYTFSLVEREKMAKISLAHLKNVKVTSFEGLLVDFAYEQNVPVVVRGVRNAADFNYEEMLHQVGKTQKLGIDTHILFADPNLSYISSSAVKAIYKNNYGDIHEMVPLSVKQRIEKKLSNQFFIGVTGEIASGKSTFCDMLTKEYNNFHNIDLDIIAHDILSDRPEPAYVMVRGRIRDVFGIGVVNDDLTINRKTLGDIVFRDKSRLTILNEMLQTPILLRYRREIAGKTGIILVNGALLTEANLLYLCNNNVVLTEVDPPEQHKRLMARGLSDKQADVRLGCQYDATGKAKAIEKAIESYSHGHLLRFDTTNREKNHNKAFSVICKITEQY